MEPLRGQAKSAPGRILGFSSSEALLTLLAGTMLALSIGIRFEARPAPSPRTEIERDLGLITTALERYRLDNQVYPTGAQGLDALIEQPGSLPRAPNWRAGGYLERMPLDPWGNRYRYVYPGMHGEFDLYSLGADSAPGGEGDHADIGNWAG